MSHLIYILIGIWIELRNKVSILIAESGLLVRDLATNILIADFPVVTIQSIITITEYIVLINTNDIKIAFKFCEQSKTGLFLTSLHEAKMNHLIKSGNGAAADPFIQPNLNDPNVQEFILMLLFSNDFKQFVHDLKVLLNKLNENIIP